MVRQRTLTPSFQGSNPCSPAKVWIVRFGPFLFCLNAFVLDLQRPIYRPNYDYGVRAGWAALAGPSDC